MSACPKEMVAELEKAAARVAVRILITVAHAFEHDLDGAAVGAVEAGEVAHGAVYLDDALGGGSGIVVKGRRCSG